MANIEVASICDLRCPYCFAVEHMHETEASSATRYISLEMFEERLDFLDRSSINQVRLIGGEPTLHPEFPELVRRARLRNKQIMVFSHGLIPERSLASLEALSPDECNVLINMNAMKMANGPSHKEQTRRIGTIKRLGPRALLGYNIYTLDFHLDYLLPIIIEANCRKAIRVGLAHPILFGQNEFLHPKDYPTVGQKLVEFGQHAARVAVTLEFDCGFIRCMFSTRDIEILHQAKADLGWRCSPILDVDIRGQVIRCFPFTNRVEGSFDKTANAADLINELEARTKLYQITGVYRECSSCAFRQNGDCPGGGLEHTIRRFRHTPFRVVVPATALSPPAHAQSSAAPTFVIQSIQ